MPAAPVVCARCIYDSSIPHITFDGEGVCSYCRQTEQLEREYPTGAAGERIIGQMVDRIKREQRGKPYDVVVGISGGCDSSFMLGKAVEWGLRPLAAHFDNTWNSTIAVENIQKLLAKYRVDLFTHVVNNEEYNDIFRAFLRAGVPDVDTASDIGLATTHYLAARKFGIRHILEGHSFRTEGISPHGWFYIDGRYVVSVHRRFGTRPIPSFPNLTISRQLWWMGGLGIRKIRPLYYLDYRKDEVKRQLADAFGWRWYGGHHMENRTAYFTNNYWLPVRFNIDLRYCELSALVRSGQLTRDAALARMREPKVIDPGVLDEVKKRLGLSAEEWTAIMQAPRRSFRDFPTYKRTFERLRPLFWLLYRLDRVPKSFYLKYTRKYRER